MSVAKEMRGIAKKVHALLVEDVKYRDSDRVLIARIWADQMGGKDKLRVISAFDLMCEYARSESKLTNVVSIVRVRRALQKANVHLRGKSFETRAKASKEVKEVLGYRVSED